jgi:hypothetical protein
MPAMWAFRAREGADLTPIPTAPIAQLGAVTLCEARQKIMSLEGTAIGCGEFVLSQEERLWVFASRIDRASAATC